MQNRAYPTNHNNVAFYFGNLFWKHHSNLQNISKIVVIGAGIVGLATAYKLSQKYPKSKIAIIEKDQRITQHQTGRNSGVIHSGIYYTPGSLKAKNCQNGYKQLLTFCNKNDIAYDICGKVIVATDPSELSTLKMLYERGITNNLSGLQWLNKEQIKENTTTPIF